MTTEPNSYTPPGYSAVPVGDARWHHFCRHVSWGAILAGFTAALALQILFILLGAGLGFAAYSPLTDDNPVAELAAGALVIQGVSAVLSLWFGGWVAGRFTPVTARATGWLHGFVVWCVMLVGGVVAVAAGAGWVVGGVAQLVGGGLSLASKPAAALAGKAGELAKDAVKKNGDSLASFAEEALVGRTPADAPKSTEVRAKREVAAAIGRYFNPARKDHADEDRAALIKALAANTGRSEAEAEGLVKEWTDYANKLKADLDEAKAKAETKAREAADKAAHELAIYSLCAFAAFLFGAIAASCGGCHGVKCARKCEAKCAAECGSGSCAS